MPETAPAAAPAIRTFGRPWILALAGVALFGLGLVAGLFRTTEDRTSREDRPRGGRDLEPMGE